MTRIRLPVFLDYHTNLAYEHDTWFRTPTPEEEELEADGHDEYIRNWEAGEEGSHGFNHRKSKPDLKDCKETK